MMRRAIILLALLAQPAFAWTGWHHSAWTSLRLATGEQFTVSAIPHTLYFTNYLPPFPTNGPSTNFAIITNSFLSDINAGAPLTTAIVNVWNVYAVGSSGQTEQITCTVTGFQTSTTLTFQARDIVALDGYLAESERSLVIESGTNALAKPVFYRSNRENLIARKAWLENNCIYFVNSTSAMPASVTNWLVDFPWLTASNLLAMHNLPINYFSYTPWRALAGDTNAGIARVVNGAFTIATRSTNSITITNVVNACGDLVTVSGTNGQVISYTCTNESIQAGFTTADYGWKPITQLFASLVRLGKVASWEGTADLNVTISREEMQGGGCGPYFDCPDPAYGFTNMFAIYGDIIGNYPWPEYEWSGVAYLGPGVAQAGVSVDHSFQEGDWSDPPNWTWWVDTVARAVQTYDIAPAIYWSHTNQVASVATALVYHIDMISITEPDGISNDWFTANDSTSTVYALQHSGAASNYVREYSYPETDGYAYGNITTTSSVLRIDGYQQTWFNGAVEFPSESEVGFMDLDGGGPTAILGSGYGGYVSETYLIIDFFFNRR
jgi:hypothetical protein